MDYERAYNEAIERAREIKSKILSSHLSTESCKAVSEYIDTIIPELAESENERTRKGLSKFLWDVANGEVKSMPSASQCQEWLSYLEKQKINTEGDFGRGYNCGYECCLNSHGVEWFEKQKPAEWSEEGEKMRQHIISDLREFRDCETDEELISDYEDEIAWLKSLRPQPKKDLSKIKNKIILALHHATNCADAQNAIEQTGVEVSDVANWLFEQDDNSQWKPSEEQMKSLLYAEGYLRQCECSGIAKDIAKLYDDLKKL